VFLYYLINARQSHRAPYTITEINGKRIFLFFPLRREDLMGFNRGVNQNLLLLPSPPRLDCGRKIDAESGRPE
jgi:hypothetical protein